MVDLDSRWAAREAARLRLVRLRASEEGSLPRALDRALAISAITLEVGRVGIWFLDESRQNLGCRQLFDRIDPSEKPGVAIRIPDVAAYEREIVIRRVVMIDDVRTSTLLQEVVAEYYLPKNIVATLDAPIYRDGAVIGVVCHEHRGEPRKWTDAEADFAVSMADIVTNLITAAELSAAEEQLRHCEAGLQETLATEALTRVARGVAHDLNNILAVIVTTCELMQRERDLASLAKSIRAITGVAQSGARLAQRLMTYGRKHHGTLRKLSIDDTLRDLEPVLESVVGKDRDLSLELAGGSARVLIDPAFLEQMLLNLVTNAREATLAGGHITISTMIRELTPAGAASDDFLVIEIADDGKGMDAPTAARCFEPFFSTKTDNESTGFGLATVQGIVGAVGGFVEVGSVPDQGAVFTVALPMVKT